MPRNQPADADGGDSIHPGHKIGIAVAFGEIDDFQHLRGGGHDLRQLIDSGNEADDQHTFAAQNADVIVQRIAAVIREFQAFGPIEFARGFIVMRGCGPAFDLDSRIALFLVERNAAGVTTRGYGTQDGGRAAELKLQSAPATLITLDGLTALEHGVDVGIAASCAEAVGVMDRTMTITAEYVNTRKQFGVAIGSFQALRHRAADMKMQLELARSMSYYASLKLNDEPTERRAAMARAKYQLGNSMRFVGQQAIQLHGGNGVTDEYPISHYFKRLTQLEMTFGDTLHHLGEVSARMTDTAGVFA